LLIFGRNWDGSKETLPFDDESLGEAIPMIIGSVEDWPRLLDRGLTCNFVDPVSEADRLL
jgi:hypothetical protein